MLVLTFIPLYALFLLSFIRDLLDSITLLPYSLKETNVSARSPVGPHLQLAVWAYPVQGW